MDLLIKILENLEKQFNINLIISFTKNASWY